MAAPSPLPADLSLVTSERDLRARHHPMMSRSSDKVLTALDRHCKAVIGLSPFVVIGTQGPNGADVTPRGDPPGFVAVLDDTHLLIPDRVGNNRFDTMANLFANPAIGLLFIVPGMGETLRVNGTAVITDDARLLGPLAVQEKPPKVGILVTVREAYLHCAKAFTRSGLWDASRQIDRAVLPSYTEMLTEHARITLEESQRQGEVMKARGLY
jgi:PPOX class probable FMN-dependent enzyme